MALPPERVNYSPIIERPPIKWPNDARVALWIAPNVEHYEYEPVFDGVREPWPRTPYPDVQQYTYRDYGNRVGFWRMLEVLDKHSIRCCVSINLAVFRALPGNPRRHGAAKLGLHEPRHLQHPVPQHLYRGRGAGVLPRLHRHAEAGDGQATQRNAGASHIRHRNALPT